MKLLFTVVKPLIVVPFLKIGFFCVWAVTTDIATEVEGSFGLLVNVNIFTAIG